jgi:hypothetical protein
MNMAMHLLCCELEQLHIWVLPPPDQKLLDIKQCPPLHQRCHQKTKSEQGQFDDRATKSKLTAARLSANIKGLSEQNY